MQKETSQNAKIGAGKPGPGRPRGVPNKTTTAAKEAFRLAFEGMGGTAALVKWAKSEPTEFYKLYARLIPAEVSGPDGAPIQVSQVERVIVDSAAH